MTTPTPSRAAASPAAVWTALGTVYVVWGSTYLGIRYVDLARLPPMTSMGVRFVLAGALLAGFLRLRHGPGAVHVSRRGLGSCGLVGVLLLAGGNGGVAIGEKSVPSGLAALLVAATPLWISVFRTVTGDRPRTGTLVGTATGFAGVALLATAGRHGTVTAPVHTVSVLVVLGATLCWATGTFMSPRLALPDRPLVATTWEMLCGGATMLVLGPAIGELHGLRLGSVPASGWIALSYLVTVGSLAGFGAFVWLLANAPVSLTVTYAYVNPVVAVVLGALLLHERVAPLVLVGGAVVVLGVAVVVTVERPRGRRSEPVEAGSSRQP